MKNTLKRIAATAAIAGAMIISAQGIAAAETHPTNETDVSSLGLLNGIVINVPVTISGNTVDLTVLETLDLTGGGLLGR